MQSVNVKMMQIILTINSYSQSRRQLYLHHLVQRWTCSPAAPSQWCNLSN